MQVTNPVRMKSDLRNIDTYDIKKSIIHKHRNTEFKIRKIEKSGALRFYGLGSENELRLAFWNPEMFELVGDTY